MFTARRRWLAYSLCVLLGASGAGCGGSSRRAGRPLVSVATGPIAAIAGGGFAGYALLTNGRVWAWGDDLEGQIGTGGGWQFSATPVEVPGLTKVIAIAGGQNTAYALQRDGTVWGWGDDVQDELGDDGASPRQIPKRIGVPGGIVAIEAGAFSAYALRRDGSVWAWGSTASTSSGRAVRYFRAVPRVESVDCPPSPRSPRVPGTGMPLPETARYGRGVTTPSVSSAPAAAPPHER